MNNIFFGSTLVALLAGMSACVSTSRAEYASGPDQVSAPGEYTHRGAGFVFPVEVAGFQRVAITSYDKSGLDIGVGYRRPQMPFDATVYVYPGLPVTSLGSPENVVRSAKNHLCKTSYEQARHDVLKAHPDAVLIKEYSSPVAIDGKNMVRYEARFHFKNEQLHSILTMYCPYNGDWILAGRATFLDSVAGASELDKLSKGLMKVSSLNKK
jgi:hypothetical protein